MSSMMLLALVLTILQTNLISSENIPVRAFNKELRENIFRANNTKLNEKASSENNELVSYNQLLPYLESKLPIPISLINQLRKYSINKNMLNKIHSYNLLRRELHGKLIENEIDSNKYSEVLSKKFQILFKNINLEEKKNFLSLINYLKMFNFDNKKLYNALHDGKDLLKIINDNKIKYLPFVNTDKKLPDLFTNNKVNQEIKRILIQYKISSKDLYNKLIHKINPLLLEGMNSPLVDQGGKIEIKDIETNNAYDTLKDRIEDLTCFNKKPKILPLNEPIEVNRINQNIDIKTSKQAKQNIDISLNKYIKDLKLLNAIEKERESLLNTNLEPKSNTKIAIGLEPHPLTELLALYLVLSVPGFLSPSQDTIKQLPYIRKTKEEILKHSHVEAGELYKYLLQKHTKESLKQIRANQLDHLNNLNTELKKVNKELNKQSLSHQKNHGFDGDDHNNQLVRDDNYYDAPQIPDYGPKPVVRNGAMKINGHELYTALGSKNKIVLNKKVSDRQKEYYGIEGNKMIDLLSRTNSKNNLPNQENFKIDGNKLVDLIGIHKNQNNIKEDSRKQKVDMKIEGNDLFDKLGKRPMTEHKLTHNKVPSVALNSKVEDRADLIDGKILFNLLKNEPLASPSRNMESNNNNKIRGDHLFDILSPDTKQLDKKNQNNGKSQINFDKFYKKLYSEFSKDNQGVLNTLHHRNKVQWKDQNVEIPNISSLEMNDVKKRNPIKAEHTNIDIESKEGKYHLNTTRASIKNILHRNCRLFNTMSDHLVFQNHTQFKRTKRSINDINCYESNEHRERQATLKFVLNKIFQKFGSYTPAGKIESEIDSNTKASCSSIHLAQNTNSHTQTLQNSGFDFTDFMFSKDADIDRKDWEEYLRSMRSTNKIIESTTFRLTLMNIEKPKLINKELLLLRVQQYKKPFDLNYTYYYKNNKIKNAIVELPLRLNITDSPKIHQKITEDEIDSDSSILNTQTEITETLETFRMYSTLRRRTNNLRKTKNSTYNRLDNITLIERKLRHNMLPNIEEYQAKTNIEEVNNTVIMHLSHKDKVVGAEYIDDLMNQYPDDPDILHKKFDRNQLEKQLEGYNKIFDQLSEETKRKYYITLDIFSRMHHIEQAKIGNIVIDNTNTETPSSDELNVLYNEFSHDTNDDSKTY